LTDAPAAEASGTRARSLGLTDFRLEGRQAPALFVTGWAATIAGVALSSIALMGAAGLPGAILWFTAFVGLSAGLILLAGSQTIERRAAAAPYAGPSPMLVLLAVLAVVQVAAYVVGLPLLLIADRVPRAVGDLIAVSLQAVVTVGVLRLIVVGTGALSWSAMGLTRGTIVRSLAGGAVFAGPVILVTSVVALVATQVAGVVPASPLPTTGTAVGLVLHLVAGAVVAPIGEELVFRGFAQTAWQRTYGVRGAIVRSASIFVLAHVVVVGGDQFADAASLAFVAGVTRIPVAVALGWLYARTGSLWAPIGLHATYNGILLLLGELATGA